MSRFPRHFWKSHNLYFVGASSLQGSIHDLPKEEREDLLSRATAVSGLSCKRNDEQTQQKRDQILQNHLEGELRETENIVLWHDVLSNTNSTHPYNKTPPLPVSQLLETLKKYKRQFACIVYIRKEGTTDIFADLLSLGILILHAERNLSSKRDRRDAEYLRAIRVTHPEHVLELEKISLIIRNHLHLHHLIQQVRSKKKPSQKQRRRRREEESD